VGEAAADTKVRQFLKSVPATLVNTYSVLAMLINISSDPGMLPNIPSSMFPQCG
jgi:hypothetical protein